MSEIIHPFPPIYNSDSKILILGSFPSVKSRENNFYYGHPQNRFWKILSEVYKDNLPVSNDDKIFFLLKHRIALWDVIESCEIKGSSDNSIRNVKTNNINLILKESKINKIFVNGKTAEKLYIRYQHPITGIKSEYLPSSSPANARMNLESLVCEWKIIKSTD